MHLSHQQRKGMEFVVEPSYEVDEQTKKKLYLALVLMMILLVGLYGTEQYVALQRNDSTYEPSHDIVIWAETENYTYEIKIMFYSSEQDALIERNRLTETSVTIRPDIPKRIESVLYALPTTYNVLWIQIGFGHELAEDEWQWVYKFDILRLGVEYSVIIEGHEFTMLVTPAQ
jgi:hypothetical protein